MPGGRNFASSLPLLFDAVTPSVVAGMLRLAVLASVYWLRCFSLGTLGDNGTPTKDVLGLFAVDPDVTKTLVVVAV